MEQIHCLLYLQHRARGNGPNQQMGTALWDGETDSGLRGMTRQPLGGHGLGESSVYLASAATTVLLGLCVTDSSLNLHFLLWSDPRACVTIAQLARLQWYQVSENRTPRLRRLCVTWET